MYLPYPPNVGGYGKLMKKTDEQKYDYRLCSGRCDSFRIYMVSVKGV